MPWVHILDPAVKAQLEEQAPGTTMSLSRERVAGALVTSPAMDPASVGQGARLVAASALGDRRRVKVSDDGSAVGPWRRGDRTSLRASCRITGGWS